MQTHVKVLAILLLLFGALGVLGGIALMVLAGGAAGLAGMSGDPDAAVAVPLIGLTGTALGVVALLFSLPSLAAGWGLLNFKPWARILAIVLCAISLINIPFGTIFGAYGLWVLLNAETQRMFDGPRTTATV